MRHRPPRSPQPGEVDTGVSAGTLTTNKVDTKEVVVRITPYGRVGFIRSSTTIIPQEFPATKESPGDPQEQPRQEQPRQEQPPQQQNPKLILRFITTGK